MNAVNEPAFLRRAHGQSGSRRPAGECNAIKRRGFGHRELTSVSIFETSLGTSQKPVSGQLPDCLHVAVIAR
jgi:hypothetical protein